MSRKSRCVRVAILGMLLSCCALGSAAGQEVRANPFLPQATTDEQRILADRERMRQAIREMMPEIRAMVVPSLDEQRATLTSEILAEVMANPGVAAGAAAASGALTIDPTTGAPIAAAPQADPNARPESARFVACINGKALYRDANDLRYFDESEAAAERCPA